jgi:GTP-binding protein HflX
LTKRKPNSPDQAPQTADSGAEAPPSAVSQFDKRTAATPPTARAIIIHPAQRQSGPVVREADARLEEAVGLSRAINLDVVAAEIIKTDKPRPSTLLGQGAVDRLAEQVERDDIDLTVLDATLSPVQQRNLEKALDCKVIDRTGLILEIFGERARTKEGRMQVALAALNYQRSRLVRSWTHLERQRGGAGFMGGPGERQIELDRRILAEKIGRLKKDLEQVKRTRALHREARERVPYPIVALVGYTNAGKSTLFNWLTESKVMAKDMLFATLDPTMRRLLLPSGQDVILSDTVGFITDLPHDLVAAFRATLEEVTAADIIVHVRDISHPESDQQKASVEEVLKDLGVDLSAESEVPLVEALNKIDLLDDETRDALSLATSRSDAKVLLSSVTGEGVENFLETVEKKLQSSHRQVTIELAHSDGETLAWLYRHGQVMARQDDEQSMHLTVSFDPINLARFDQRQARSAAAQQP